MFISALISSLIVGGLFFLIGLAGGHVIAMMSFIISFIVTFIIKIVFGIPITILLKKYNKFNEWTICLAGFWLGFLLNLVLNFSLDIGRNYTYQAGNEILIDNGVRTIEGWIDLCQISSIVGGIGLFASVVYYEVLKRKENNEVENAMEISQE